MKKENTDLKNQLIRRNPIEHMVDKERLRENTVLAESIRVVFNTLKGGV